MADLCRHCHLYKITRPRALCWRCYYKPAIRDLYPSNSKFAGRCPGSKPDTETMADLERLIAEQLPTMPKDPMHERSLAALRKGRRWTVPVASPGQRGRRIDRRKRQ